MKYKSFVYIFYSIFLFKIAFAQTKKPLVTINGQICRLTKLLKEGLNCNEAGCLNVPANYSVQSPLLYIRGLKQSPAATTQELFNKEYNLGKLNQIVFTTASADTNISNEDIKCLQNLSRENKIDVAAHSAGYIGLEKNASNLSGKVRSLFLLDNFYDPQGIKSSVSKINAEQCSGFVTPHNRLRFLSIKPMKCQIESKKSNNDHVSGVIDTLEKTAYRAPSNQEVVEILPDINNHTKAIRQRPKQPRSTTTRYEY